MDESSTDLTINETVNLQIKSSVQTYFRYSFSRTHMSSAYYFAKNSQEIEGKDYKEPTEKIRAISENKSNVMAVLFFTVSFLEATINELFKDARESDSTSTLNLSPEISKSFSDIWRTNFKRFSTLDKYQKALTLAAVEKFNIGQQPYQDVKLLTQLRNSLIHYEPEWIQGDEDFNERDVHRFEKLLTRKFALNQLMEQSGNPFYPDKCLGFGCAKWAIESSLNFTDEFFKRLGIPPTYDDLRKRIIW